MHHKYIVRDGADVWTGSTNWTLDSWTRQENVLATLSDPVVAAAYARVAYAKELQGDLNGALQLMRMATDATSAHDPEGQAWHHVQVGDLLFTIDKRPFQNAVAQSRANLAQSKANLAFATADLDRAKHLVRDRTITEQVMRRGFAPTDDDGD